MASSTNESKHLQPLNTNWQNRSLSNVSATSDAATFHSAHDHPSNVELNVLSQPTTTTTTTLQALSTTAPVSSQKLSSIKMSRQDSGYSEMPASPSPSTPRTSTSSTRRPSKRRTSKSSSTRPPTKRASRSSPSTSQLRTSTSGTRPSLSTCHTANAQTIHQPYKFFHFPTLTPATSDTEPPSQIQQPPPATVQYWTSDSTRRLEYAAIDAASKGVRGFFIRLVPDCILPDKAKRTKFHDGEREDAGSVRRYRLVLPEEKEGLCAREAECEGEDTRRAGLLRRWTAFARR